MAEMLEVEVTGIDELQDALYRLGEAVRTDIGQRAVRAAVTVFEEPMRAAAPRGRTGMLPRSIASEVRSYGGGLVTFGVVGPLARVAGLASLVEHGTGERYHASGKSVGRMPASPFVEPAFVAHQSRALSVLSSELAAGIESEVAA